MIITTNFPHQKDASKYGQTKWDVNASTLIKATSNVTKVWVFMFLNDNLNWGSNCWIHLYRNIHNISGEHVNKFVINLMNKKYAKTFSMHCNKCF